MFTHKMQMDPTYIIPLHQHETVAMARECERLYYNELDDIRAMIAEADAEARNERWFEERGGGYYAGSEEEARDRFMDSLLDEQRDFEEEAFNKRLMQEH